jgi:sulfatase maturation enzyme AslB (radical SAM superfamily)
MQTNGLATEEEIHRAVEYGGNDISVSLDSLWPEVQEKINGDFPNSWHRALKAMSLFTKYLHKEKSFASIGCVLQPMNLDSVPGVVRFATEISWYSSLVPIHVTDHLHPRGFRTFDPSLNFGSEDIQRVRRLIGQIRSMRAEGHLTYDSDEYLDDIERFVRNDPVLWRRHHNGLCDSPNLYFVILPNGEFAPCCDYRLASPVDTRSPDFPGIFRGSEFRRSVETITRKCPGCMYGSFPEMTISMRVWKTKMERMRLFLLRQPARNWPISYEAMLEIAERIRGGHPGNPGGEESHIPFGSEK